VHCGKPDLKEMRLQAECPEGNAQILRQKAQDDKDKKSPGKSEAVY